MRYKTNHPVQRFRRHIGACPFTLGMRNFLSPQSPMSFLRWHVYPFFMVEVPGHPGQIYEDWKKGLAKRAQLLCVMSYPVFFLCPSTKSLILISKKGPKSVAMEHWVMGDGDGSMVRCWIDGLCWGDNKQNTLTFSGTPVDPYGHVRFSIPLALCRLTQLSAFLQILRDWNAGDPDDF